MKITFSVDMRACMVRGFDATSTEIALDIDPAALSERERMTLANFLSETSGKLRPIGRFGVLTQPNVEGVKENLAEVIAREDEDAARTLKARDAQDRAALDAVQQYEEGATATLEIGLDRAGNINAWPVVTTSIIAPLLPHVDYCDHPEYVAAREACKARVAEIKEASLPSLRAKLAEVLKREQEEKDLKSAAVKACEASLLAVAEGCPNISRAAKEGYSVTGATLKYLALQLADRLNHSGGIKVQVTEELPDYSEREAPSASAFDVLDVVEESCEEINATLDPAIGQWTVDRISRIDVCPHRGSRHYVTGVVATLNTPITDISVIASHEDMGCNHDDY